VTGMAVAPRPPPVRSLRANDSRQPNRLTPNHHLRNAFRRACPLGLLLFRGVCGSSHPTWKSRI